MAGVRAAGVTRGWGRTNPEPGGPYPDPSPSGVDILGLGNPKGGERSVGLTRKGLEDPNRPVPGWGQPAGGGGVPVWSYFSRRACTARIWTSSHLAIRYMETPAARPAASAAVTEAEDSARVCSAAR